MIGVQAPAAPQTFATPPPPLLSPYRPYCLPPCWVQLRTVAAAPEAEMLPAPQVSPVGQPPQSWVRSQPSPIMPQYLPPACWQGRAVQLGSTILPQAPGT